MRHLNRKEKAKLNNVTRDEVFTRYDWTRRLQYALIALARSDPQWMIWVEREVNPRWKIEKTTRLIEAYTRARFLKPHGYFGRRFIGGLIFRDDWCFTERGTLSPG